MLKRTRGSDYSGYLVGRWMVIQREERPDTFAVEMVTSEGEQHRLVTVSDGCTAGVFVEAITEALHLAQYGTVSHLSALDRWEPHEAAFPPAGTVLQNDDPTAPAVDPDEWNAVRGEADVR